MLQKSKFILRNLTRNKLFFLSFSFDGSNGKNRFGDVLSSLTRNDPGIGTTCMKDFVSNRTLVELSKFGAECSGDNETNYQEGFLQNYSDEIPGKMKYNCECTISDDYNKYAIWYCPLKTEDKDIDVPGRNLMQTKDILFDLTNLRNIGSTNSSTNNDWILGKSHKNHW